MPKDLYATLSNGTQPPLPDEQRTQLLAKLEEDLQYHVAVKFRPLKLPDDFQQLCALTNALYGPALPVSNYGSVPHAFDGLSEIHICSEYKHKDSRLDQVGYEIGVSIWMGGTSMAINGGHWLRWCKDGSTKTWKWRRTARLDRNSKVYQDVKEVLHRHGETDLRLS